jgi:acylphosphatase
MKCYISGKVQGVWYRASAKQEAQRLGLTGFARNLPDGRVEVLACGDYEHLNSFHDWLKKGPPLAKVMESTREDQAWQNYNGFDLF